MRIQTFLPQHPILRQHISYYYFLITDDPSFEVRYYSYPTITTPLNIHRNATAVLGDYSADVVGGGAGNMVVVQGMRSKPLFVRIRGQVDKITIHFKPLGINHFIKKPFANIAPSDSQFFTEWDHEPGYAHFTESFYASSDIEKRVSLLEIFLLGIYKPMSIDPVYEKAIAMLTDFETEMGIQDIVSSLELNRKALHRFFHKHIGISPIGFKKIARFRHSMNNKLVHEKKDQRLTDICYESNFYDQSYFINVYREITGLNPKSFFQNITGLAENRLVLRFLP